MNVLFLHLLHIQKGQLIATAPSPLPAGCASSMAVEIPPNCWCIPNKWVKFSRAITAAEVVGKDHTSNQAGRSEKEKLSIGDDKQVGRSNQFITERNVKRALQSPEQLLGGAAGAVPNLMLALY